MEVKANFRSMLNWVSRGIPLLFGALNKKRSLVVTCISHSAEAKQIFSVSDGEDISTTVLLQSIGIVIGKPARLMPISPPIDSYDGIISE